MPEITDGAVINGRRWSSHIKGIGTIFLFFFATVLGVWAYVSLSSRPPDEKRLLKTFYMQRATYDHLRDMLLADGQVRAVYARLGVETTESGLPRIPSEVNFPSTRYDEYRGLLDKIRSPEVFRRGENNSEICFTVWAAGFGGDTRHVDTCWLDYRPVNEVARLADFYKTPKPRRPVFEHIDGNWYLWADW
jgi:hypothetical protein